jgi:hypothetical protein
VPISALVYTDKLVLCIIFEFPFLVDVADVVVVLLKVVVVLVVVDLVGGTDVVELVVDTSVVVTGGDAVNPPCIAGWNLVFRTQSLEFLNVEEGLQFHRPAQ